MFSQSAVYAVCALSYMAQIRPAARVFSREIAAALGFPPPFLTKILRAVAAQGLLESQRGKAGGFRLARPASEITIREIIQPFPMPEIECDCLLDLARCGEGSPCPLHEEWMRLKAALNRELTTATLETVARSLHLPRWTAIGSGCNISAARVAQPRSRTGRPDPGVVAAPALRREPNA